MINQFDEIINCPKSGGDLCYKIEVNKDITNYYSLSCGFWTNSLMTSGSDFYNEQMVHKAQNYTFEIIFWHVKKNFQLLFQCLFV